MKYYTFRRTSNDFHDILHDIAIKKSIVTKISWDEHLLIGFCEGVADSVLGYLVLKYGEEIVDLIPTDFTPIIGKDYIPREKSNKDINT